MKKLIAMIFTLACVLALTACGSKAPAANGTEPGKYALLEQYLDNEQYDLAITMIQDMKAGSDSSSDYVPAPSEVEPAAQKALEVIPGTYTYNYDLSDVITINSDMTITLDGKTYPFTISASSSENEFFLDIMPKNEQGQDYYRTLWVGIYENGLVNVDEHYNHDAVKALCGDQYMEHVGNYVPINQWCDFETFRINEDYTVELDGSTYPVVPIYDNYDGQFFFMYIGSDNYSYSLRLTEDDNGMKIVNDNYLREDDLEYVEVTADTFFNYFEWSDWTNFYTSENGFGDVDTIEMRRYLQLKPEYQDRFIMDLSNLAIEYTHSTVQYNDATVTIDLDKQIGSVDTEGCSTYEYEPSTEIKDQFIEAGYYDENRDWHLFCYSVITVYLSIDPQNENTTAEDNVFTSTTFYYDYYFTNPIELTRCNTTLVFAK